MFGYIWSTVNYYHITHIAPSHVCIVSNISLKSHYNILNLYEILWYANVLTFLSHVQELELASAYQNDDGVGDLVRQLMALSMIPLAEVRGQY